MCSTFHSTAKTNLAYSRSYMGKLVQKKLSISFRHWLLIGFSFFQLLFKKEDMVLMWIQSERKTDISQPVCFPWTSIWIGCKSNRPILRNTKQHLSHFHPRYKSQPSRLELKPLPSQVIPESSLGKSYWKKVEIGFFFSLSSCCEMMLEAFEVLLQWSWKIQTTFSRSLNDSKIRGNVHSIEWKPTAKWKPNATSYHYSF